MMNLLIIPDTFKGSMSSTQVARELTACAKEVLPDVHVDAVPVADGGEGTLEAFQAAVGGQMVVMPVTGPCGRPVRGRYLSSGTTAVIEAAEAAGLHQRDPGFNAMNTTTYGVGELIASALQAGHKHIILGLGGTCTNDGGCGLAAALGVTFLDKLGRPFIPTGSSLQYIYRIIPNRAFLKKPAGLRLTAIYDVKNTLLGHQGAAAVYGRQKGVSEEDIPVLEEGLKHLAQVIRQQDGPKLGAVIGGGAAGGAGAGVYGMLNFALKPGIDVLLDAMNFTERAQKADCIITGEGRLDSQTLQGKVVAGVASRAGGKPVIVFTGGMPENVEKVYDLGVTSVVSINPRVQSQSEAMSNAKANLRLTALNTFRLMKAMR